MLVNMIPVTGRADLPGIEALLSIANSRHGPGAHAWPSRLSSDAVHDHLESADEARGYFAEEGIALPAQRMGPRQLDALRRLREATWALVEAGGVARLARLSAPLVSRARFRFDQTGSLQPAESGWPGFVAGVVPSLFELSSLRERLKICRNPECGWLFLDRTRNQNRVWCDMSFCGNRAKVSRHSRRHRP